MFRNILSKLPVLNNLSDVPTSPCNVRMLRSLSPTAHECRRDTRARRQCPKLIQKRSYSFPFARQKIPQTNGGLGQFKHGDKNNSKDPNSNVSINRRDPHHKVNASFPESAADIKKFYDNYEVSEQYELEASKPRRSQSELDFNVFKHMEKLESKYDPIDYLQPNNLKPFGSMDNVYYPAMIKTKDSNVLQLPKSDAEREPELSSSVKKNKTKDNLQHREYSTITRSFHSTPQGPVELIDNLPLFDESGHYRTNKSKLNQSTKKAIPVRNFLTKPKPNQEIEEALGVAKECRKKLIESKYSCENRLPWYNNQIAISSPDTLTAGGEPPETLLDQTTPKKPAIKLATPWLSYSDTLRNSDAECAENSHSSKPNLGDEEIASHSDKSGYNPIALQKRALSTETPQPPEVKSKKNRESIFHRQNTAGAFQRRMLATEPESKRNVAKTATSNLHVSVVSKILPTKKALPSEKTYIKAKSYAKATRPLEPKSCEKPPETKKCFLPSKVRLKPPVCTPKPPPCPVPEPCVRSDDCLKIKPKRLPVLKASDCPCVEEVGPEINPKMKRLCFEFPDPPRVCPDVATCAPRADDNLVARPKNLASLKPNDCLCVDPPPMTNVKLKRLQKICVPDEKCYPKPECPQPPPCIRADDNLMVCDKPLPQLKAGQCPCVEPESPKENPKMKRLEFCFRDPPKPNICEPIDPCAPRADARLPEKHKRLPKFEPSNCECIESPPMTDIPLKRLQKICIPEAKCYPKKECPPPEPCIRADDCWKPKIKPLPVIKDGPCICIEPHVPDKMPKMKRLDVECGDDPKPLSCEPVSCQPRADESLKPRIKKLPHIEMGNCRCIDAPPMVDIPLKRLQKVCEPEERCYPKKPCPQPEPCLRADDSLCVKAKPLPSLEASDCPCVEIPPLRQAPALKRLELKVCEPPKKCPKPKICEEVPRADDTRREKTRQLPKLKAGDCPCVDHPLVEAPPLERLVCKDVPEECLEEDPCVEIPRADMGCWEYYHPEEPKCDSKKGTKKGVSYNSKRKYNTDSRMSLFKENNDSARNKGKKPLSVESSGLNEVAGRGVVRKGFMLSNRSTPTLQLLKQLGDLEKKTPSRIAFDVTLKRKLDVRRMSMKSSDQQDPPKTKMKKGLDMKVQRKKKPGCHKVGSICTLPKLQCTSTKCEMTCDKERIPVCCDKKPSPYPAFSELAEEEVEPFSVSDTKPFTCGRKEYGFHPRSKRPNGPQLKDKDNKNYSTLVAKGESKDNENMSGREYSRAYSSPGGIRLDDDGNSNLATMGLGGTNIAYLPLEPKFSQLLKQRANYGVVGIDTSIPKLSSGEIFPAFSRLRTTSSLSKNISVPCKNSYSIIRRKSSSSKKHKKCKSKKKKCPKFKMENCPEPTIRPTCIYKRPVYDCAKEKSQAPYPAFTDCLDEELAENLSECPMEREKVRQMQPSFMHPLERPKVFKPVDPVVGKIDPLKEHECVKAKLAIENQGLTQSCHDFGKSQKVMRAKHYLKDVHRDCVEIERLRKLGKWPPKNSRGLCHVTNNLFCIQRRGMCKTARNPNVLEVENAMERHELQRKESTSNLKLNTCPKNIYIRKYHVLCTKPEKKLTDNFDIRPNDVSQYQLTEDDSCKFMKLRNVQWRINNFQKWHRLQRMNSSPEFSKKLCSGTRKLTYLSRKTFSTSATKLVSLPEPLEASVQRGMSTTYILAGASANEHGVFSMKGKRPKISKSCPKFSLPKKQSDACQWKYPGRSCKKLPSPYPAFSECKHPKMCDSFEKNKQLQPQYPILPELSSGSLPEPLPQPKLDLSIDEEYARQKFGVEKVGLTLDCNTFGIRRKTSSSTVAIKEKYEMISKLEGGEEFSNCSAYPEWCRTDKIYDCPPRRTLAEDCSKPKSESSEKGISECDPKGKSLVPGTEREETAKPKEDNACICKMKAPCENKEPTLWQKIVQYFKARPNCPAPDEWKKKAARLKAEKFAKVAGLVVCDPKDLPPKKGLCGQEELPKVITTKCPKLPFKCDSDQSKRSFSTTCVIQEQSDGSRVLSGRCLQPISRATRAASLCHRRYSTSTTVGDDDKDSLGGDDILSHEEETLTRFGKVTGNDSTPVGDEDRDSLDDEDTITDKKYTIASREIKDLSIMSNNAAKSVIDKDLVSNSEFEQREISKAHEDLCEVHKMPVTTGKSHSFLDILRDGVDDESSLCDENSVRNLSTEKRNEKGRRYYSTRANWHNLEDINKSLEEEEKKRLAKKILKPFVENVADFEEDLDDNLQEDKNLGQRRLSFFDVIFQEPVNDTTGYNQARAFAAFWDFFHKMEVHSDVNYEEIETQKTNSMVQELDRLMDSRNQKKEE